MICAQEVGQHPRVERVTLGATLPKSVPGAVERLGIDRIDDHAMAEQKIDYPAVGPLVRNWWPGPEAVAVLDTAAPHPANRLRVGRRTSLRKTNSLSSGSPAPF